jgi:hypothetical protein
MANGGNVLMMLCPDVVWTIVGDDYNGITWHSGTPAITKQQFEDGFAQYDSWKSTQNATRAAAKAALLAQLGITEEQAKLLLS